MKQKPIDTTAGRMGAMLRSARQMCKLSTDDASSILHILPDDLAAYEHGVWEIPLGVLEHMFIMGYKMIQVRIIEHRYHNQRKILRQIKQISADVQ